MADRQSTPLPWESLRREALRQSTDLNALGDEFALRPIARRESQPMGLSNGDDVASHSSAAGTPQRSSTLQTSHSPTTFKHQTQESQRSIARSSMVSRRGSRASRMSQRSNVTDSSDQGNTLSSNHPSTRTTSSFGFPRSQSPYQGPTGPSQPYAMYAQDTVTRTPSTATTSTVRPPDRAYSGPNGPTQPYGMYPQGTVPDDDPFQDTAPPNAIGFPGLAGHNYQRRLGPDGEDADDFLGPDGFTEQLPPYSRYANEIPPKSDSISAGFVEPSSNNALANNTSPNPRISIVPPVVRETPADTHTQPESDVRQSTVAVDPFSDVNAQPSPSQASSTSIIAPPSQDEKAERRGGLARKAQKRVCCGMMPCWLLAVMLLAISLAVLVGGIIGGALAHHHAAKKGTPVVQTTVTASRLPTATVTADAEPVASTPANLPALPTGIFGLTLNNPSTITNSCLTDDSQTKAWDCSTGAKLSFNISVDANAPVVSVSYPTSPGAPLRYGAQPPELSGQTNLRLMQDKSDFSKGPAYFFSQEYNKTVILRESELPGGSSNSKRRSERSIKQWLAENTGLGSSHLQERHQTEWEDNGTANPSDRPWYCFWNGTVIEGFIYLETNIQTSSDVSATSTSVSLPASTSESASNVKRQAAPDASSYPRSVKIEERRTPHNTASPYCQQMQILDDFRVNPVSDSHGNIIQISINEEEPWTQKQLLQSGGSYSGPPGPPSYKTRLRKRQGQGGGVGSDCECIWKPS